MQTVFQSKKIMLFSKAALLATTCLWLSACATLDRMAAIGEAPPLSGIENPTMQAGYQPISLPMPAPLTTEREANSLWRAGARSFFKDQRAGRVGDLLTVMVDISDSAKLTNETSRERSNTESNALTRLFGLEAELAKKLPEGISPGDMLDIESELNNEGKGEVGRNETVNVKMAALVTQVLPNGNLVIFGRQEVRINFEVRELTVAGIVRPEDISSVNSITSDKIAEARISYGGRGQITDVQQPRYGSQMFDIILPF